tara:strand:- start:961 stop:2781 length:1821 start_codon:yes stop_codon:yes gene_type:complete
MCGISGIVNLNNQKVNKSHIELMMTKMNHRGPDDNGMYFDHNVGLGFVRLSILDLSEAGHQPMKSSNSKYIIIFNGEVYNYKEIRKELKYKYQFNSETDTEVVLAAYQEWGEKCLNKFNGMFSFVIYNIESKEIFGARDRFGIKPFYYFYDDNRFIFASEIKSIIPLIEREPNNKIIYDYLLYNRTDHTNETFFKGIIKLNHGSYFKLSNSNIKFTKWYDLKSNVNKNKYLSKTYYRKLFNDSLKLRLRSDVPVGVTLSGGIDSSSITSSLINDFNLKDINTFSAIYGSKEKTDESYYINEFKTMAKNMSFIKPNADSFFKDFKRFIEVHNEPVPDIGPYAQYKVMELASTKVKVTLDGQGADEQLGGYHYFFGIYYKELLFQLKFIKLFIEICNYIIKHKSIKNIVYFLFYLLPTSFKKRINKIIYPSISQQFIKKHNYNDNLNNLLYNPKNLNQSLIQHFEYKLEHLLKWEDLNSMSFSIESRVPFLDHKLVESTLSSPPNQKIKKGETKHLLRQSLLDILPIKIINRKDKKGFSNPREKWFKSNDFKKLILEIIQSDKFIKRGYFDQSKCIKQYKNHISGKADNSKEIWKWINLEIWFRKFID